MNSIVFDGRLVRDPETEVIPNGMECVKFTVANERRKKDDKQTSFITCKAFGKTGAFVAQYFKQGDPINVAGEIELRPYEDKNGVKRTGVTVYIDKAWFTIGKGQHAETVSSDQLTDADIDNLPF